MDLATGEASRRDHTESARAESARGTESLQNRDKWGRDRRFARLVALSAATLRAKSAAHARISIISGEL